MKAGCSKKGDTRTREAGYEALAAAVVGQAITDYYYLLRGTRMRDDPVELEEKYRLERFFQSQKFMLFADVNGERLMRLIQSEVENDLQSLKNSEPLVALTA